MNIEARNQSYPRGFDEHMLDGPDERWIGRGGSEWVSDPCAEEEKGSEGEPPPDRVERVAAERGGSVRSTSRPRVLTGVSCDARP